MFHTASFFPQKFPQKHSLVIFPKSQ
ncbi:rCG37233 [Rattus norvegicus]|uniref:RCG37233 n=1 Tax=Rattus norvegicus TaxID=10116 RepID=A6KHY6_RAT|nr:rCG37233 [Rattus norvegicus]